MADQLNLPSGVGDDALEDKLAELLGLYIDRINAGEFVDQGIVSSEHPEEAPAVISELENLQLLGDVDTVPEPLGTLGDYTLRRQIGRGGMGVVYDAWQNSVDRQVALKVLPAGVAADERALQRFVREAKTAAQLNHQNIVHVHGMGVEENTPYYSMEHVEGETLAQVLAKIKEVEAEAETPFGPKDRQDYFIRLGAAFADVADGLQHAHSKGVIHRDIKPSNLILDQEGRLRILDFGLARLEGQESLTISGDLVGTPLYMSPEQARQRKIQVDHRTDVYSHGATMYETVCGRPPFKGKDHQDTLSQIIERDPVGPRKLNSRVPNELETIVLKCLRKDPGDRYGTAEALGQDLRRFVRGDPIEASPELAWQRTSRYLRRHRTRAVTMTVIVLLLGVVIWLAWKDRQGAYQRELARYEHGVRQAAMLIRRTQLTLGTNRGRSVKVLDFPTDADENLHMLDRADFKVPTILEVALRECVNSLERLSAALPARPEAHYFLANALLLLGKDRDASIALGRGLVHAPDFVPARTLLLEIEDASWGAAGSDFEDLIAHVGASSDWETLWLRAHRHARVHEWVEASEAYGKLLLLEETPYIGSSMEFRLDRGVARLNAGYYHGAVKDFAAAWGLWRQFLEPGLLLGKTELLMGKEEEAERTFQELYDAAASDEARNEAATWITAVYDALGSEKKHKWSQLTSGGLQHRLKGWEALLAEGDVRRAAAEFRAALESDPTDATAMMGLGFSLFSLIEGRFGPERDKQLQELVEIAEKVTTRYPYERHAGTVHGPALHAYCLLAFARLGQDDAEAALSAAKKCFEVSGGSGQDWAACDVYAVALERLGNFESAEKFFRRAVARGPEHPNPHNYLGKFLQRRERYVEAASAFRKALQVAPRRAVLHSRLAGVLNLMGEYAEAVKECRLALEFSSEDTLAHENLALALWKLGQANEGLKSAESGIALTPDRPRLLLVRGMILESQERLEAAAMSYHEVLRMNPNDAEARQRFAGLRSEPATPEGPR